MSITLVAKLDTARLDEITRQMEPRAQRILKSAAEQVEGIAKTEVPIDTGALRNSISNEQVAPLTWWVSDGVEYGIYQELGFRHFGSGQFIQNAFMVPAVERVRPTFEQQWDELFL